MRLNQSELRTGTIHFIKRILHYVALHLLFEFESIGILLDPIQVPGLWFKSDFKNNLWHEQFKWNIQNVSTHMAYNLPQWDIYHQKTCDTSFYNAYEIADSHYEKFNDFNSVACNIGLVLWK